MTKVFQSSTSKILSTNTANIIESNKENIIESDSDFREVVKKGYLLSQINLTTIPDIIQDAINEAIVQAKNTTLSDSLIQTLIQSLENLDSGIYKKTFIDNTISYLENIVTQKVSLEQVASIADSKIALATQNLVATSQVELLRSRIGNSESEIINVKNTINTKDLARANQILELEASIGDTFAGYSEAIDLTVDSNGNVKSQKIETLSTNIGLQLQEINQLIVDNNNEWSAKSVKLITSPTGAITGYSFQDGSGLKSTFEINADNFKIANSYNTFSPFSIVGTSLYFNGKISFTNTTNVPNFVLDTTLSNALITVNADITTAQNSANSANVLLTEIASDNKLTANEKINTKKEWDIIVSEYSKNITQANTYTVSTTSFTNAYNSLNTYISSLLTSLTTTSDIVGTTFRSMFKAYYDARTDLLNAIATKIKNDMTTTINNLTKVEDISWQQEVQNAINNNATYIDGGKITTGYIEVGRLKALTITADKLAPSSGTSTVWKNGGLISDNFNGNPVGNIGAPTVGFRLSANAEGTSLDPNIYGAYIKASYIESLYSPVIGTNNSGKFNYASSGSSVTVYGPLYSSGFIANRVTSLSSSILIIRGVFHFSASISRQSNSYSISKSLERSINGGVYTSVQTKSYSIAFGSIYDYGLSISHSLEFYYIEDLSALGSFNSLTYTIPGGTVQLVLHN